MTDPDEDLRRESRRSALFFLLTLVSVAVFSLEGLLSGAPLSDSVEFAAALMGILLAHEMGHYVVARLHGFALSLPVFLPFPSGFGTLGAIIGLRSPPANRQALLEMGIAGPISGAVVAFTILWFTLPLRGTIPDPHALDWLWGFPPVAAILAALGHAAEAIAAYLPGDADPTPRIAVFNDPMIVRLIGRLLPGGGPGRYDILHPAALAGWVGCLVTGINLLPIGQLDGGHVLNAVFPRAAPRLSLVLSLVVFAAGYFWRGWFVWGAVLLFLGASRPVPVPEDPPLPMRSRVLAVIALVLFALTFMPVPIEVETLDPSVIGAP
jgi:membrane-associated protease RseP (regulator of RpoE activity)